MSVHDLTHLHYRSCFTLRPRAGTAIAAAVLGRVGAFAETKVRATLVGVNWFAQGGDWRARSDPRLWVSTRTAGILDGSPRVWGMRLEHADREFPQRRWRVEVVAERQEGGPVGVAVAVAWRIAPEWLGEEPPAAAESAPWLVRDLLDASEWDAVSGPVRLTSAPALLRVGKGEDFREKLASTERGCPVVFVSAGGAGKPLIDEARLAGLLAGAAAVVVPESAIVDEELQEVLPKDFRCWGGGVRLYQPGVRFDAPADARRHRFILPDEIVAQKPDEVVRILVRAVIRRGFGAGAPAATTLEEVEGLTRALEVEALKKQSGGTEEWAKALEADNAKLAEEKRQLKAAVDSIEAQHLELEERLEEAERQRKKAEYQRGVASAAQDELRAEVAALQTQLAFLERLKEIPNNLHGVARFVELAWPHRIVFTERALESAKEAKFRDLDEAFMILRAMATILHDLHFAEALSLQEIQKRFREKTSYELAVGETGATMSIPRLAKLRVFEYKGDNLDATTHVKKGIAQGNSLRVHYHPHRGERKIVVAHCGDHLETRATT